MGDARVQTSCGNVFADLGLPNPEEALAKARLSIQIEKRMKELGLTQAQAAQRMDVSESDLSGILRGDLEAIGLDRLLWCLNALGEDVQIVVRHAADRERGQLTVAALPSG